MKDEESLILVALERCKAKLVYQESEKAKTVYGRYLGIYPLSESYGGILFEIKKKNKAEILMVPFDGFYSLTITSKPTHTKIPRQKADYIG